MLQEIPGTLLQLKTVSAFAFCNFLMTNKAVLKVIIQITNVCVYLSMHVHGYGWVCWGRRVVIKSSFLAGKDLNYWAPQACSFGSLILL